MTWHGKVHCSSSQHCLAALASRFLPVRLNLHSQLDLRLHLCLLRLLRFPHLLQLFLYPVLISDGSKG